jgi:hypothetical protein
MRESLLVPQPGKQPTGVVARPPALAEKFHDERDPESRFLHDRTAIHYDILTFVRREMERKKAVTIGT